MSLNRRITLFFILFSVLCTAFTAYEIFSADSFIRLITAVGFVICIFIICVIFLLLIKNHVQNVLIQLSEVISSIADKRETEVFSVLNDDLLSKLQSQVIKLSGNLRMQNLKLRKEKNEIKSLISDIAHQLKNPLANLNLYISFLMDENVDIEKKHEFGNNVNNQLEKLNWLMEGMIKMSRLESGIIQLNPETGSLNDILLTSLRQVYDKAVKKDLEIYFEQKEDILLIIDKRWTAEAFTNIMDNAVKYTQNHGKIKISVHKYEIYARVDIADNGTGFEEAEINNIFKRFYRGKNAINHDGVGIGLYLSRQIITMQEGYIKVKSEPGKGSIFSIFLPLQR